MVVWDFFHQQYHFPIGEDPSRRFTTCMTRWLDPNALCLMASVGLTKKSWPKTRPGHNPKRVAFLEEKWDPLFQGNLGWWNILPFSQNPCNRNFCPLLHSGRWRPNPESRWKMGLPVGILLHQWWKRHGYVPKAHLRHIIAATLKSGRAADQFGYSGGATT